jgi:hypothetical protein
VFTELNRTQTAEPTDIVALMATATETADPSEAEPYR